MAQPAITLTVGAVTLTLDADLHWSDEFTWFETEQHVERGLTGALIIDQGARLEGRPITLEPPEDAAAWMVRATLAQIQAWEADPAVTTMTLSLRGVSYDVLFRRHDGPPIEARPVIFVADPLPGGFGDWYLATLRFMVI